MVEKCKREKFYRLDMVAASILLVLLVIKCHVYIKNYSLGKHKYLALQVSTYKRFENERIWQTWTASDKYLDLKYPMVYGWRKEGRKKKKEKHRSYCGLKNTNWRFIFRWFICCFSSTASLELDNYLLFPFFLLIC